MLDEPPSLHELVDGPRFSRDPFAHVEFIRQFVEIYSIARSKTQHESFRQRHLGVDSLLFRQDAGWLPLPEPLHFAPGCQPQIVFDSCSVAITISMIDWISVGAWTDRVSCCSS
jgi:hypothetical protein